MPEGRSTIGAAIRAARRAAGLTQAQLAEAISVERATVTKWENGKHAPSDGNLQDVARALAMSVESLREFGDRLAAGPAAVREATARYSASAPAPRIPPRAYQRIYERVELMEKAGVPEQFVDEARRLMSDETFNTLNFRVTEPKTEQGWIDDIDAAWEFIRDVLAKRGIRV